MSDEKKIKESFNFSKEKTKKILRKAKLLTTLRTIVVSVLIFLILSIAVFITNSLLLNRIANNMFAAESNFNLVAGPNTYISQYQSYNNFLTGEGELITHRIVGNRPVYNGTYKIRYTIIPFVYGIYGQTNIGGWPIQIEINNEERCYNKVYNREMVFYHPQIEYEIYQNDLGVLEEVNDDKYIEMALSFDRDYSVEEVKKLIPETLRLVWYWVDTYNQDDLDDMGGHYVEILDNNGKSSGVKVYDEPNIMFANQVYGMKGVTVSGLVIEDPCSYFISAVKFGADNKSRYQWEFKELYDRLSDNKEEITEDSIRVIGVVVTGDITSMKLLQNENYIKATSMGIVADKY